ncbi:threonine-phosphate decarboxylase CobD [Planctomycetota bacterium]
MDSLNKRPNLPSRLSIDGHGGDIYRVTENNDKDIIDFSANINPLGFPAEVKKVLKSSFDRLLHYPDPHAGRMTKSIAQYWNIGKDNILAGNGSVELIYLVMQAFMPKTVCIPVPSFSDYERAARLVKSSVTHVTLSSQNNFMLDLSAIQQSDILIFGNPNNPTGNLLLSERKAVDDLPCEMVIADEAFMDFVENEGEFSLIRKATQCKKIIVLRTFTKFYAIPGLRGGYMIAHKDIIDHVKQFSIPWTCNVFTQIAAETLLNNNEYMKKTRMLISKEREYLFNKINKIKLLSPYSSEANYLLIRIENRRITSSELAEKMIHKGILIRDCSNYKGLDNRFFRIAVRTHRENVLCVNALKGIIE